MKYMLTLLLLVLIQSLFPMNTRAEAKKTDSEEKDNNQQSCKVRKNSIGMEFVWVEPGEFQMGSKLSKSELEERYDAMLEDGSMGWDSIKCEFPQHRVILTKGFWVGRHEITQAQYYTVMGKNPSHFRYKCSHCNTFQNHSDLKEKACFQLASNHPVESVTLFQAIEFCEKLSEKEERRYTLPTEAQWEYTCRAGTTTPFYFGGDFSKLREYAWYDANASQETHPVGQKKPNAWGLFDMHGNVSEWCLDFYNSKAYLDSKKEDPANNHSASLKYDVRVVRGGCFLDDIMCRSSSRGKEVNIPSMAGPTVGFRVICWDLNFENEKQGQAPIKLKIK